MRHRNRYFATVMTALLAFPVASAGAADTIKVGGTGASTGMARIAAEMFARTNSDVTVEVVDGLGTSGGIRAMTAGAIAVSFSSRMLKEKESGKGVVASPFLRTPFVLVTSMDPAPSLDTKTVAAPYLDPHSKWPDGTSIKVILRPKSESDTTILANYFPGMPEALQAARARSDIPVAQTDQDNASAAEKISGSLTMGTLVQMLAEERNLRTVTIDGVAPSVETVRDGSYPYSKVLYMVHAAQPDPAAAAFIAFLRSPAFAERLLQTGAEIVR